MRLASTFLTYEDERGTSRLVPLPYRPLRATRASSPKNDSRLNSIDLHSSWSPKRAPVLQHRLTVFSRKMLYKPASTSATRTSTGSYSNDLRLGIFWACFVLGTNCKLRHSSRAISRVRCRNSILAAQAHLHTSMGFGDALAP